MAPPAAVSGALAFRVAASVCYIYGSAISAGPYILLVHCPIRPCVRLRRVSPDRPRPSIFICASQTWGRTGMRTFPALTHISALIFYYLRLYHRQSSKPVRDPPSVPRISYWRCQPLYQDDLLQYQTKLHNVAEICSHDDAKIQ